MSDIKKFLVNNENEIITLVLESSIGNHDKIMRDIYKAGFKDDDIYVPKDESVDWDTRQQMINDNRRLLIFSDNNADVGPKIMSTYRILENHYDAEECLHRGFKRLKLPPGCKSPNSSSETYKCLKKTIETNHGYHGCDNNHGGTIIFLMNHFPIDRASKLFEAVFDSRVVEDKSNHDLILDYYGRYNSYENIKNRIKICYCSFEVGNLEEPSSKRTMLQLKAYPSVIAMDFLGIGGQEGPLKIVREIALGDFTVPKCDDSDSYLFGGDSEMYDRTLSQNERSESAFKDEL